MCVGHHAISDSLTVEEGDWLVTRLDDDFLCTDVIRETLNGPHSAKQSFFTVRILEFWGKQRFAGISDHSLAGSE